MNFKIKNQRLKIVEQIAIVLFLAVVIPMSISGFIINNVNQQAIRKQLKDTAILIANMVSDEVDVFESTTSNELQQLAVTINYMPTDRAKYAYLNKVLKESNIYKDLSIVYTEDEFNTIYTKSLETGSIASKYKLKDGRYLVAIFDIEVLKKQLFNPLTKDPREIYVLTANRKLITSHNYDGTTFQKNLKHLPKKLVANVPDVFGRVKNQPYVYIKKDILNIMIIVNTPKDVTVSTIEYGRFKIILFVLIPSLTVLFIVVIYTYYLYINIRQLFKAIIAISKGNYHRRVRLLSNIFTPYEVIFLAFEFNRMVKQINKSYSKLKKSNKELKELNEFRSNMIDTVSHEFRTPLTSIQGYTSRLLRQDIEIDKETQLKSLKIIKKQSERLKRLIEDLLVIPDIEDSRLKVNIDSVSVYDTVEDAILLVKNNSSKTIINHVPQDLPPIYADRDRFEQVIINLIENAVKYADEDSDINVSAEEVENNKILVSVQNKYQLISREKLKTLFDKFTRIDDKTTRTTRGTGLGLFIVKGLVEVMGGEVRLYSTEETGFTVKLFMDKVTKQ